VCHYHIACAVAVKLVTEGGPVGGGGGGGGKKKLNQKTGTIFLTIFFGPRHFCE